MSSGHISTLAPNRAFAPAAETSGRHRLARRHRLIIVAFSIAAHLGILAALLTFRSDPPKIVLSDPPPIPVALIQLPPPTPKAEAPQPPAPKTPAKPPPKLHKPPPLPAPPEVPPLPAKPEPKADQGVELTAAQLAGAAHAGSGSGGGGACDVAAWLQSGLRKDARVQAALNRGAIGPDASGKAVMVWNGDWVRSPGEDGAGLAVIREAIMMEILSAPAACRMQPMRGLILVSPSEGAGTLRLALGTGEWRWSELLVPRGGVAGHGLPRDR